MTESRLNEVEIRLLHQERALEACSTQLIAQQRRIDALALQVEQLLERLRALAESPLAPPGEEGPPPHY